MWCTAFSVWAESFSHVNLLVQPKMAKIYGAGGIRGLEAYQSGFLMSPDGHVLTAWSYVLDTEVITVRLHDGRRFEAEFVGADPQAEIAILKIDVQIQDYFDWKQPVDLTVGDRVLAFSNLYGIATGAEPTSVLHGTVSAVWELSARRGTFKTPFQGKVYVLDAMTNNAGAAGGALTDREGNLAGILGKELRNAEQNIWLNYALPIDSISGPIDRILSRRPLLKTEEKETKVERPWTLAAMGIQLIPDVLNRTPPFIESVVRGSPAAESKFQPDDLVMYINQQMIPSQKTLRDVLSHMERDEPLTVVVIRDNELVSIWLEETQ